MKHTTICILLLLVLSGCRRDTYADNCKRQEYAYIGSVTGPTRGNVQEQLAYSVSCGFGWACSEKGPFDVQRIGNDVYIRSTVFADVCAACAATTMSFNETYYFMADRPGLYYLHFYRDAYQVLTDTVSIN